MFIRPAAALSFLAALALLPPSVHAEDAPKPIATVLQPYVDRHILAGAVTLVANREKVLDVTTVGYADVAAKKPIASGSPPCPSRSLPPR